ncbi:MAG: FHA domain-containing protein [Candidatus Eremiobacteraeota bacterium]|nr:FHA domain-containing protein [Candidatus Eremiobacteraeota bacterium]
MTFAAAMRAGSVEAVLALAAFAVFALRGGRALAPSASPDRPLAIELEVIERGRSRRVEGLCPLVVGRATDADLLVMDPEVSRRHARFESDGAVVFITDLQSSNGTTLNGQPIRESIELRPGDRIDVGSARIVFLGSRTWN